MSPISFGSKFDVDRAASTAMTAAAGAVSSALRAGKRVPAFELPDTEGNAVSLDQALGAGPVVLNFLRGAWCAFGEESLAQLASTYENIVSAGASAFAIAPPGRISQSGGSVPIPELADRDMKVARAFGLAFELPVELRPRYLELGYVPPKTRKSDSFLVPIPATYLVDQEGVIVLAHIDADYRHHLDSEALLAALKALQARTAARKRAGTGPTGKWRLGRDL
ncbi:peroxiredoxin-like family protein [Paraburkholderia sp. BCC1876]|uniref:peroxiredoxin-like family protein n=1 Tax=Paraburkholderia sp. BCC1876 TaxID=2676303 RepID=UPI00158FAF40|nr:peroxiredoxin-like family protein [Paraburkholderia sp. BCC1876]